MDGRICGIDLAALLARAGDYDREVMEFLLLSAEAGALEGAAEAAERQRAD